MLNYNKRLQEFYENLSDEVDQNKGAQYQKDRFVNLLYRSRLKFNDSMEWRLATAGKKIRIFFYPPGMSQDLKINSRKRALHVREFYYQDNINLISDKVFVKRLLKSLSDLLEFDESY